MLFSGKKTLKHFNCRYLVILGIVFVPLNIPYLFGGYALGPIRLLPPSNLLFCVIIFKFKLELKLILVWLCCLRGSYDGFIAGLFGTRQLKGEI